MGSLATKYTICGVGDVLQILKEKPQDAVISIHHPEAEKANLASPIIADHGYNIPQRTYIYWDNDVEELEQMCTPEMAADALDFMRMHRGGNILIHCKAGKARSASTALMGIADELGPGRESEAVDILDQIRNICTPNPLIVRVADKLLGRDGALVKAVKDHAGIEARMPEWYEGKLRGMRHFHGDKIDPEKVLNFPPHFTQAQKDEIIKRAYATSWKPQP